MGRENSTTKAETFSTLSTPESRTSEDQLSIVDDASVTRKVDWRVVPIMLACYTTHFLDKVLINYANVMGLQKDLHMKGNDFSWMATAIFIGFAVAETPQGILLQRFPVKRVLGINILQWGILICASSGAQDCKGMLVLRTMLGFFKACIAPSLVLTTAAWYTKRQSGPRYGLWNMGVGFG